MNEDIKPLVEYINTELQKGTPEASLKAAILKQGWSEEKYNLAKNTTQPAKSFWKILLWVFLIGTLAIWPFAAFITPFLFDAPGTENSLALKFVVKCILIYPIIAIVLIVVAIAIKKQSSKVSLFLLSIPLLYILLVSGISTILFARETQQEKIASEQQVIIDKAFPQTLFSQLKNGFSSNPEIFWDGDKRFISIDDSGKAFLGDYGRRINLIVFSDINEELAVAQKNIGILTFRDAAKKYDTASLLDYKKEDIIKIVNFEGKNLFEKYKVEDFNLKQ